MILSVNDVLQLGLRVAKMSDAEQQAKGQAACVAIFRGLYGPPPVVVQEVWEDLCNSTIATARIPDNEKIMKGFKMFMIALYFLWTYPKNARMIECHFSPIGQKNTRGEPLWKWIRRIEALLPSKIRWLESLDDPNGPIFTVSVDGTDCKTWEKRNHPTLPYDPGTFSQKFNHGAVKYEIGVAIFEDKIVWVSDVSRGGRSDITIFREDGLLDLIPAGKMAVGDRGYPTSIEEEMEKIAYKRNEDPTVLKKFKAREMTRHETVNGRIKCFEVTSGIFRHGMEKHQSSFKAVCVLVQYCIDNGAYLFQV